MKSKTIALWITITGVLTVAFAAFEASDTIVGVAAIAFMVFAFMGAYRLNKEVN